MKKQLFYAFVILMPVFYLPMLATAQVTVTGPIGEYSEVGDTIVIHLKQNNKVLIVGNTLNKLKDFGPTADRLKTAFLNDIGKAFSERTISSSALEVHYFVQDENKRRIKAEAAEYSEKRVDVAFEILRLKLDLPKFNYTIYNLNTGLRILVFMNHPDSLLSQLGEVSLNEAIVEATKNKKLIQNYYKVEVATDSNYVREIKRAGAKSYLFQVVPTVGVTLFGNTLSPVLGSQIDLRFNNKYGIGKYRVGFLFEGFPIIERTNGEITSINGMANLECRFLFNTLPYKRNNSYWLGVQAGFLIPSKDQIFNAPEAFKFGFTTEVMGPFSWSFDLISIPKLEDSIYSLTVRLPF
jgi:hypothetical protein